MTSIRNALGGLLVVSAITAASAQTGGLRVRVFDAQDDSPLPGVTVSLTNTQKFVADTNLLTDKNGVALFPVLRPGPAYFVEVYFPGYQRLRSAEIRIKSNETADLPFKLTTEQQERVLVQAHPDVVDLEKTSQSTRFGSEFVSNLPVQGRFYQNMLSMAPGVQDTDGDGNPTVRGSRDRDFKAMVGGVSNVDPLTGQSMNLISPESIEEIEIITGGAGAEFGRAQGGFANIIQKQGSNDFEGVFNTIYSSSKLDGNGATNLSGDFLPEFSSNQPSITVSGPIMKDRLWYHLSYEYVNTQIPVNTGVSVGVSTTKRFVRSERVTWQLSPRNKLAFHRQSDPVTISNQDLSSTVGPDAASRLEGGGPTYSLVWTAPYSPKMLVETQVHYQDTRFNLVPQTAGVPNSCVGGVGGLSVLSQAQCFNIETGVTTGSYFRELRTESQRLTVKSDATLYGGRFWGMDHQFKFGMVVENERYHQSRVRHPFLTFFLLNPERNNTDQQQGNLEQLGIVIGSFGVPVSSSGRALGTTWGIYGSDQVKPLPNLTITLGLRMDRESINSDGFNPLDPESEYNDFFPQYCALPTDQAQRDTCDVRGSGLPPLVSGLVASSFTAYEGLGEFKAQLAPQLGFTVGNFNLSSTSVQSSGWANTRRATNFTIANNNLSPKFAVSWDPWSDNKTKFTANLGRSYNNIFLGVPLQELVPPSTSVELRAKNVGGQWQVQRIQGAVNPGVNITEVDRNLKTPYQDEYGFAVERELWAETSIRLVYGHRSYKNQFQDIDLNHVPADYGSCVPASPANPRAIVVQPGAGQELVDYVTGEHYIDTDPRIGDGRLDDCVGDSFTTNPAGDGTPPGPGSPDLVALERPDGILDLYTQNAAWGDISLIGNFNSAVYQDITVELRRRQYRNWQMEASYVYSKSIGNGEDFLQALGDDRTTRDDERGYQSNDQRHVVKIVATTITPWGFRLGTDVRWQSGLPYSLLTRNFSSDGVPPMYSDIFGAPDARARIRYPTHRRNDQRNRSWWNFDVRLVKEMNVGKKNLQLTANVFNLLNDDTLTIFSQTNGNNAQVRRFGRRFELGARLAF